MSQEAPACTFAELLNETAWKFDCFVLGCQNDVILARNSVRFPATGCHIVV